jgi:hypothetical protein
MTLTHKLIATAALAGGIAMMASSPASAYVACNSVGDCWHTDTRYASPPGVTFTWHPDEWYFHQRWDDRHHWRDYHEGRGYWRNGVWLSF